MSAPSAAFQVPQFSSDSNNSVVASANVNGQVAFWLGLQTTATPAMAEPTRTEAVGESASGMPSPGPVRAAFRADGRLSVSSRGLLSGGAN